MDKKGLHGFLLKYPGSHSTQVSRDPLCLLGQKKLESGIRIERINIYSQPLPVIGGAYRMASATVSALDSTLVEIVADNGLTGWGETCPIGPLYQPHHAKGARAALDEICPCLVGLDTVSPRAVARRMDEMLSGHGYAKAAVDIAVLDLLGKHWGVPVSTLLGGALTDIVPSYYSLIVGEPEETARIAADKVGKGYPRLQIKLGGRNLDADVATIRKVYEAVGNRVSLAVDGNRGMTISHALLLDHLCAGIPFVFEQPCNTMEEVQQLKSRLTRPVFLDENTEDVNAVLRAISTGIADGFGFKVTRLGGLTKAAAARDMCALRSLPHSVDDAWGGDIIAAACVHLAATVEPKLLAGVWMAAEYIDGHYDSQNPVVIENGHISVPQGPGLGVHPDHDVIGNPIAVFSS